MPIYEYECPKCGRFDVLQKMSSPAPELHDACGSKVKKLMSASAFSFKGSGFYITDYRKDSYKKDSKKDSGNSGSAKGTDSKPKAAANS